MTARRGIVALLAVFALAAPALTGGCANDVAKNDDADAPKKKRTVLVTEYDDLHVGEEASQEIEAELGLYESEELQAYVSEVGRRLVQHAALRPFVYTFQVVNQMAPNAFSLPGGHIYVSRGLLALANTEDELANVLGHEIIHASDRHVAAQQELARRTNPFTLPYFRLAKLAAYSRDHERAADRGGQILAAKAGYDPNALSDFLKHLGDSERLTIGYSRLTSYFDTHPGTTERVSSTAARAVTIEWTADPMRATGRAVYLRRIDGIILDTHPAEGIFQESEFIHPDMDFRILFPRGWQLVNTHQAVGAMSPDGRASFFMEVEAPKKKKKKKKKKQAKGSPGERAESEDEEQAEEPKEDAPPEMPTPREAAERFVKENEDEFRVRVRAEQPIQLGDIEAYRLEITGVMSNTSVAGYVTFIPHGGLVLRLITVARSSSWDAFNGRAHTTVRTFRPLTEEERNSVEVLHLRLVHALGDEDIAALSQRTGNAWSAGMTAVLNGVFVDARFAEGDLVKFAQSTPYVPKARDPKGDLPGL